MYVSTYVMCIWMYVCMYIHTCMYRLFVYEFFFQTMQMFAEKPGPDITIRNITQKILHICSELHRDFDCCGGVES